MRRAVILSGIIAGFLSWNTQAPGYEEITLRDLAGSVDAHKGKTITLRLKLKSVDYIFNAIVFYDKKNHDIEFDMAPRLKDEAFASMLLNAREGVEYLVTFEVVRLGSLGYVIGDLKSFVPVALEKLPEGGPVKR